MGSTHVHRSILVRAPLEHVFAAITDHEAMARWPGVSRCRLVREGTPRNGLGAVREIRAGGLTLQEEVVAFEPPRRFDYKIIRGLPVDHLGSIALVAEADATRLSWDVRMASRVPLLAQLVGRLLGRGLDRALPFFARETERSAPAPAPAKPAAQAAAPK